jgi:hypothetical protein
MHALSNVSGLETVALLGGTMVLVLWIAGYIGSKKWRQNSRKADEEHHHDSWQDRVLGHCKDDDPERTSRGPPRVRRFSKRKGQKHGSKE